ncbi:hypothetical protein FB45DRAFT_899493 [Roridomyces roridus]|uniref:Uncharacterized protein n=1 Tax=Roridomyces roridus TaxID=1738132 RepID=A0AAD7C716_9AGAR|nr:hypothetical protein FB45DRAFT_899493 [Roridomyces roridus]
MISTVEEVQQRMGHVNMMADTVLLNASPEDLRAILRSMLASKTPGLVSAFMTSTRARLLYQQPAAGTTPVKCQPFSSETAPQLQSILTRARLLYGTSPLLASVVRSTLGCRWPAEGTVADVLAVVDGDLDQALQSCREELTQGDIVDLTAARKAVGDLVAALESSRLDVDSWDGEFPFERAVYSARDLRL